MRIKKKSIVLKHKIFELISKDITEIARISIETSEDKTVELEPRQYFVSQFMFPLFEIDNKLSDLNVAHYLVGNYPAQKVFRKNVTRERYITFNLEYYLISQVALLDRLLHLCNFVYELGFPDGRVNYTSVIENSNTPISVKRVLQAFQKYLKESEVRKKQNFVKHQGRLKEKGTIERAALFEMASNVEEAEDSKKMADYANLGYKLYIRTKKKFMEEEIKTVEKIVLEILDTIYPTVYEKYSNLN